MTALPAKDDFFPTGAGTAGPMRAAQRAMWEVIKEMPGNAAISTLTIAAGVIVPTTAVHAVDTESAAAADDLTHMTLTNIPDGRLVMLRSADAARVPTIKHGATGTGQYLLADGKDFVLTSTTSWIVLRREGNNMVELGRFHGADYQGALTFLKAMAAQRLAKSGDYSILAADRGALIAVDASGAARTMTLPSASSVKDNFTVGVMKIDSSANAVTVARNGANINGAAADRTLKARWQVEWYRTDGTNWEVMAAARDDAMIQGRHTIFVPAAAMAARGTNGAADGSAELSTNKIMRKTLDFDQSTAEYAQFAVAMPKGWDEGTIAAVFHWTAASGSGAVVWAIRGLAVSDDDALDQAMGTAQSVTDTLLAANDQHRSGETAAVTIAGTPAENDLVIFEVYRDAANGSDTLNADALLLGVTLFYTVAAGNDA